MTKAAIKYGPNMREALQFSNSCRKHVAMVVGTLLVLTGHHRIFSVALYQYDVEPQYVWVAHVWY